MFRKIIKTLLGIILIPVAIGIAQSFFSAVSSIRIDSGIINILERSVLVYLLFHVVIMRPVYLYVLGHECVHVVATWLCLGKVEAFSVTPRGGNVITSKTNFFIELSPYFIPFYTIVVALIFFVFKNLTGKLLFPLESFIFVIGVTLTFHLVMTVEVLKIKQEDIMKSGLVFSMILIFIGNLLILMAIFCPFFRDLSFSEFFQESISKSRETYIIVYRGIFQIIHDIKVR